ncbi:MAG: hypothetical protein HZB31_07365 [Nitrospirae bacterium]|nr:hypothetical protein [Nitrospirota bacterium]
MKRSKAISLTLIATVSLCLQGCSHKQATNRELYESKQKCIEDWGSEQECEEDKNTRYYYGPHYYYRGGRPLYFPRGGDDPVPVADSAKFSKVAEGAKSGSSLSRVTSTHVSRGGFGRLGSFHGSGS